MTSGPVLIIEDEQDLRDLVEQQLRREGFETLSAATAEEGLRLARTPRVSLVLLDLMLPDLSGIEVCRRLRADAATKALPIIMVTARSEEIDRVVGFEVGADDYVVKSNLSMRELTLRVRAVLRRRAADAGSADAASQRPANRFEVGGLVVNSDEHRVWVAGEEVVLTATEFKLLTALIDRSGRVQTRGSLLEGVWEMAPDLNTRTVDTHVKRLREKLGIAADYIETVRGVGYRFNAAKVK